MPRNPEQNEQMKEERRAAILDNALRLFAAKGLAATRIAEIAKAAGMSQGLLYHYYRSKEEVFTALIGNAFTIMNGAAAALEALPISAAEKIRRAVNELFTGLERSEHTGTYHLLIAAASASEGIPAEARAIITRESRVPYEIMARIVKEGQVQGTVRSGDPEQLALLFWTTIKGLAIHRAANRRTFRLPDPDIILRMFLKE
ncbi:TetR/AcrR family transcriptional regulator [bacterium]|nr:TetR/AcrR family transcriptional regulator [bacterium]